MGRKVIVVRHGERVDFTFGYDWYNHCFDAAGAYIKNNLNMPDLMIQRSDLPYSFDDDCPLTQVGELQGVLVGKGFKENNTLRPGFEVYVSPALRSIQTAAKIMSGMGDSTKPLRIEPSLFEWTGYVRGGLPNFTTQEELKAHGFTIDTNYKPVVRLEDLIVNETTHAYCVRTHELVSKLLGASDNDILLVGHGGTLGTATSQLVKGPSREGMSRFLGDPPYACVALAEHDESKDKWAICEAGNLTMRHGANSYFNCRKQFS